MNTNGIQQRILACASIALALLCIPAGARDIGIGVVWRVTPSEHKILIRTYAEENERHVVAPGCTINVNGKAAGLDQLLKFDRVMAQKLGSNGELVALEISRPYDEAQIGKIAFSTGTALAPDSARSQISVLDGTGEYSRFSISEKTEIWDRIGAPRRIKAEEIKTGDSVSVKHRFYFPVREALIISVWKHKERSAK